MIQMLDQLFTSNTTSTTQPGHINMRLISVWANKRCLRGKYFPNDKVLKMALRILEGTKWRFSFYGHMLSWTRGPSAPQRKGIMQKNCNFFLTLQFITMTFWACILIYRLTLTHNEPGTNNISGKTLFENRYICRHCVCSFIFMHVMSQQVFGKIMNKSKIKFNEARKFLVKWLDILFIVMQQIKDKEWFGFTHTELNRLI